MRYLVYGEGNAREHVTFLRLVEARVDGHFVGGVFTRENALLERDPDVRVVSDVKEAIRLAKAWAIDVVLVLSPHPILDGDADAFAAEGFQVFGGSTSTAWLEGSKAAAKAFMRASGVPTAEFVVCEDEASASRFLRANWGDRGREWVLKSDRMRRNAAERVVVPSTLAEALEALTSLAPIDREERLVIEERLAGPELSIHVLSDGRHHVMLPLVQDYKRRDDGDRGPNTHGMGSIAATDVPVALRDVLLAEVVEPTFRGLEDRGLGLRGVLCIGVVLTSDGPKVLEYNVRSGNPEWVALMLLLEGSLRELVDATISGRLSETALRFAPSACAAVVMTTTADYPFDVPSARRIEGLAQLSRGCELGDGDHAVTIVADSVGDQQGALVTRAGRVLGVGAKGASMSEVRARLEPRLADIRFDGMHYRRDILARTRPLELP